MTNKHIGIIACSAEGAALCYRTIIHESAKVWGKYIHPEVSMHSLSFSDYMRHIEEDNWEAVADMMVESAKKLENIGAQILICPDNTIHQSYEKAKTRVSLPWLHIAEVVAAEAQKKHLKKLLITGTKYLMEGPVYSNKLSKVGIDCVIPDKDDRQAINEIIFDELVNSIFKDKSIGFFIDIIDKFVGQGCDGVVLGCTEIPLIINNQNSSLPVLDSTRLLAKQAIQYDV